MLILVARRLKLSYNVLNLRNLHCRPSEQCQTFNHNNNESNNSKSIVSKRFGDRCKWNLRHSNPNINYNGTNQYKKIVLPNLSDKCWWTSQNFNNNNQTTCERNSLVQNPNNCNKDERKTVILSRIGGECDWNTSDTYNTNNQCILKRCEKEKKRKQCNCEFLNYHWNILKWTTGFIGSIYASKLMCLYARRRRNNREWQRMEQALTERQKIQKEVFEKQYNISKFQRSHVPADRHAFNWSEIPASFSYQTIPIKNDHDAVPKENKVTIGTQTIDRIHVKESVQPDNFNVAVSDLKSTVGHWEFKLGVQSLKQKRPEVAISHFTLASVHHHPEATYNLGICYEKGIGTNVNLKIAKECYRAAANLGHSKSMYNLAVFFAQGKGGLKKDYKAARDLFKAASRLGSKEAKAALGIRIVIQNDASQILTDKSYQITSELNPAHRAGLSLVV